MTPQEQQLITNIEAAFKGVKREDGITLHQAIADDDYLSEKEQLEARKLDTESRWQDIPDEVMKDKGSVFSFLDTKGFRYYLPAFMRCSIRQEEWSIGDTIIYHFYPISKKQGEPADFVASMVKNLVLTPEQCQVIHAFMKYSSDEILEQDEKWTKSLEAWGKYQDWSIHIQMN